MLDTRRNIKRGPYSDFLLLICDIGNTLALEYEYDFLFVLMHMFGNLTSQWYYRTYNRYAAAS